MDYSTMTDEQLAERTAKMIVEEPTKQNRACVYEIEQIDTGRKYIGGTQSYRKRKSSHRRLLGLRKHKNRNLQEAWNGGGLFVMRPVIWCDSTMIHYYEQIVLDHTANKFNIAPYTDCSSKDVHTSPKLTPEQLEKKRIALLGNTLFKGKNHSEESKRKMSMVRTGEKRSIETRKKMSESAKRGWIKRREACLMAEEGR